MWFLIIFADRVDVTWQEALIGIGMTLGGIGAEALRRKLRTRARVRKGIDRRRRDEIERENTGRVFPREDAARTSKKSND